MDGNLFPLLAGLVVVWAATCLGRIVAAGIIDLAAHAWGGAARMLTSPRRASTWRPRPASAPGG